MEKEFIDNLNEIRKEIEMPMDDFVKIMAIANMHREKSKVKITDEKFFEIIQEALTGYDYTLSNSDKSSYFEAIRFLLSDERKERHVPDAILFDTIEEYLNLIEEKPKKKSPEEAVERAVRTLGL